MYPATGILLAGGKSSRMGRDKALIRWGNQTFLQRSIRKLEELFEEVILVTNETGRYRTAQFKEVTDIYAGCGPLGGIHAGITASRFDWAFVTACDMPFWEASVVHELMKARSDYDAVVPVVENKAEPLFSLYRRSCLPAIERCLNRKMLKVTGFYPLVQAHYLDMTPVLNKGCISSRSFSNINTLDDLSEIAKD